MGVIIGYKTPYLKDKLNDHWVPGRSAYTPPSVLYAALTKQVADPANTILELAATGNYSRATLASGFFAASVNGYQVSTAGILWPVPSADWLAVYSITLYDALTGGNALWVIGLSVPMTALSGVAPSLASGVIQLYSN